MATSGRQLLDEALSPDRVFLTRETKKQDLLDFLISRLCETGDISDFDALRSAIMMRERLMSTGIGLGIGVPHARISCVRRMIAAAAINHTPLADYGSIDDQPVQIVFLVAGRPDQQSTYVRLLASLSAVVKPEATRKHLLEAESAHDAYALLLNDH